MLGTSSWNPCIYFIASNDSHLSQYLNAAIFLSIFDLDRKIIMIMYMKEFKRNKERFTTNQCQRIWSPDIQFLDETTAQHIQNDNLHFMYKIFCF